MRDIKRGKPERAEFFSASSWKPRPGPRSLAGVPGSVSKHGLQESSGLPIQMQIPGSTLYLLNQNNWDVPWEYEL